MPFVRLRPALLAIATIAAGTLGCSADNGVAPRASAVPNANNLVGTLDGIFTLQLRMVPPNPILPPNPIFGFGHLQLRVNSVDNSCVPPNPITPQPGTAFIAVCGKIFNEGGALYQGGRIYVTSLLGDGTVPVATFNSALPPNPCRRYDISGVVTVPDAIAADMTAHPEQYQVLMDGSVNSHATQIGGRLDGSAWGPVGTRPETDPYFAEKVCTVAITP